MDYGRYRVKKELGRGMNVVYLAYDPQMDSQVALKVLSKESVVDENILNRFIKEAQVTRLVAHPNISQFMMWAVPTERFISLWNW
jgi:serine/threonine protein kinase